MKAPVQNVRNIRKNEKRFYEQWELKRQQKAEKLAKEQHEPTTVISGSRESKTPSPRQGD
jgi:hypothetical protein